MGVLTQEFVDGTGGAGELGVVVVVDDDDSLFREAGFDEGEAGFDRPVEVAVAEGEGDFLGEILGGEVVEPGFFDDDERLRRGGWAGEMTHGF